MTVKAEFKEDLCITLLTELLAYQFASPVRWIETQNVILNDFKAEKIIEVGPSPILTNMITRTINANDSREMAEATLPRRRAYCTSNHLDKIYYNGEPPENMNNESHQKNDSGCNKSSTPVQIVQPTTGHHSITNSSRQLCPTIKLEAKHILRALISNKLPGSKFSSLDFSKSLKQLCQGKSTLQNEIKSDFLKEFKSLNDDNIEDIPLTDLSLQLEPEKLGPVSLPKVLKYVSRNFAGDFSSLQNVRCYLTEEWGMTDPNPLLIYMAYRNDGNGRLESEKDTKLYIDDCCYSFAVFEHATVVCSRPTGDHIDDLEDELPKTISLDQLEHFRSDQNALHTEQHKVLGNFLSMSRNDNRVLQLETEVKKMQDKLTKLEREFGGALLDESIKYLFSPSKVRIYSSSWNWVRQDVLRLVYSNFTGSTETRLREIDTIVKNVMNRIDGTSLNIIKYYANKECHDEIKRKFYIGLIEHCEKHRILEPTYGVIQTVTPLESIEPAEEKLQVEQYIKTISLGKNANNYEKNTSVVCTKLDTDVSSYYKIETELFQVYSKIIQYALAASNSEPVDLWSQFRTLYEQLLIFLKNSDQIASYFRGIVADALSAINKPLYLKDEHVVVQDFLIDSSDDDYNSSADEDFTAPETTIHRSGHTDHSIFDKTAHETSCSIPVGVIPLLHIKRHSNTNENWVYDKAYTQIYLNNLLKIGQSGISLSTKTILLLIQGASKKLIREVIGALLQAGATVLVATNEYSVTVTKCFQDIYHRQGAKGSRLVVLPLNHASHVDGDHLCDYIYSNYNDLDYVLPMITPELNKDVSQVSSVGELHARSSVSNLLRLLKGIVEAKKTRKIETRPTFVLLPLSPVDGIKNSNEFLSESYTSLNKVLDMWHVEDWRNELSFCGCIYGWTLEVEEEEEELLHVQEMEKLGIRIFSSSEMAFNVIGLLAYDMVSLSQDSPIVADLNGGLHSLPSVMPVLDAMRSRALESRSLEKHLEEEALSDASTVKPLSSLDQNVVSPKGNIGIQFPNLLDYTTLQRKFNTNSIDTLIDPSLLVVITGFSEIGPWGNAKTRWEMESTGVFSLEGCIEMAWIMGLIKYQKNNETCGWIDSKTGAAVEGLEIKKRYEPIIMRHSGIRLIEPELFEGYNPSRKQMLQEVILNQDLEPIRTSAELGQQYKLEQGDSVEVLPLEDDECLVKFLKGATLYIPKALDIERLVAGQIPSGWDARSYGVPDDIASSVDPITLFALVSTAEALIYSGITDPYEMYEYVHVSEVGNCVGSGIGGLKSHSAMQVLRTKGEDVQNDILPETFINITAAWINMLLISSSGPIKTPVGACATAVESLEAGYETIRAGKAMICIVGGVDDFNENVSHEFANMGATSNSTEEMKSGRDPQEMCRPATSSRNGFMESQGAGIQIIMRGDLAIKMGAPIYGIVGLTSTASDKISKSLPAPGKGILTSARERSNKARFGLSKLDIKYRKRQLESRIHEIRQWSQDEILYGSEFGLVEELVKKQILEAKLHWGTDFWKSDPNISPIRGALSVFGLSIDDLNVVSCHGTSTKANEKNESQIIEKMMAHLGRTRGNPVMTVYQKYLTGHPKGAAGAWMLNGCLQMLNSSIIPGNRNADNIDDSFECFEHLVFPSLPLHVDTLKACMITSFGFGQKGAMALVLNPNFLLACLSQEAYDSYREKRSRREMLAQSYFTDGIIHNKIVQVKDAPPYAKKDEEHVYLDPLYRLGADM